jgi:hypothetical protein
MTYAVKMVQRTQTLNPEILYVLELMVGLAVGDTEAVTGKTHRIPRIACDTINCNTAESLNIETKQCRGTTPTFEYGYDTVIAVAEC